MSSCLNIVSAKACTFLCLTCYDITEQYSYLIFVFLIQSLEANRMAVLVAKLSKIEEASKKREEQENNFISQTREALEQKMEAHIEKRENYINDLRTKLKEQVCIPQFYISYLGIILYLPQCFTM